LYHLVSRTRCSALALPRRAGTQEATRHNEKWAPALQRTVEVTLRCVRGTSTEELGVTHATFRRRQKQV